MYMVLLLHAVAIAENFDSDDLISTPPPPISKGVDINCLYAEYGAASSTTHQSGSRPSDQLYDASRP